MMKKYHIQLKQVLFVLVMILIVILLFSFANRNSISISYLGPILIFLIFHWAIFEIDSKQTRHKKDFVFLPAIMIGFPTLFFLTIYIWNQTRYIQFPPGEDSMHEDYSIVLVIIFSVSFFLSILISWIHWMRHCRKL